jgi:transcriptional regulator with XRE-family HTH domain
MPPIRAMITVDAVPASFVPGQYRIHHRGPVSGYLRIADGNKICLRVNHWLAYDVMETDFAVSALGDRLRAAREARSLTLDQLSASTGVSKAHLSRLESGDRQPSVGILVELATALGTRVGALFGEDVAGTPLATFTPDAPRHTAAGLEIASSSGFPDSRALEAMRVHVPADREPPAAARHRGEEWIYVLRGTLELEYDGVLNELREDMAAHFDAARPHRLSAARTGAELLLVSADYRPALASIQH